MDARTQWRCPDFLFDKGLRLLLFGGKGGVGKTTCAASAALHLARRNADTPFLLVSIDPAHSLADSLAGAVLPSNLTVLELDAAQCLAHFRREHDEKFREMTRRGTFLDDEDINRFIDLSLPGLDELMAFFEISRRLESTPHQRIIVDTAPTGHSLRFLAMPGLMIALLRAMDSLLAKHRHMKKVFSGSYRPDELDRFVEDLAHSVERLRGLLTDAGRCRFVPVLLADPLCLDETDALVRELDRLRIPVSDIVVNKMWPDTDCPQCRTIRQNQLKFLRGLSVGLDKRPKWLLPMRPVEVRGAEELAGFWDRAVQWATDGRSSGGSDQSGRLVSPCPQMQVESAADLPLPETRLLLFAGKGGVGKTTLACATALRLAQGSQGRRVLLCSTDPAHSLSACLGLPLSSEPKDIAPSLSAMELDATAELASLRSSYEKELADFLGSYTGRFDFVYDRQVMEKLLDLSPPGIDEVMAVVTATEMFARESFDILVVDCAPSGHLIRLLEMPNLVDRWLKAFLVLLHKYRDVMKLARVSVQLARLSRALRKLQTLLRSKGQSAVYSVTNLSEMAHEETCDLSAACSRLGIRNPSLFVNLATRECACEFCSSLCRHEQQVAARYRDSFADKHITTVFHQLDPRGMGALAELGRAMYMESEGAVQ